MNKYFRAYVAYHVIGLVLSYDISDDDKILRTNYDNIFDGGKKVEDWWQRGTSVTLVHEIVALSNGS